jgi:hypothetical protein
MTRRRRGAAYLPGAALISIENRATDRVRPRGLSAATDIPDDSIQ